MPGPLFSGIALCAALSLTIPAPGFAQNVVPIPAATEATQFNTEQLDAMLAPIALFPDALLAQVLMASTFPFQIVEAARWLDQGSNKQLTGDALARALATQSWDPSVKSLVPFPQILTMMNGNLDWLQQLGYAVATQQPDVMDSAQRLRRQAQAAGTLTTTAQQKVTTTQQVIVIEPANPEIVFVPIYDPRTAFGTWPYAAQPPVFIPPPPGYAIGSALVTGLAFAAGVAVVGSLWGWARPSWGGGYMNVNVNRFNSINVNRTRINNNVWRPPPNRVGGLPPRAPAGPVGRPARPGGLPPNAIGRPNVQVPSNLVGHPRPNPGPIGNRPIADRPGGDRPNVGRPGADRPNLGQRPENIQRPGNIQRPASPPANIQRPANVQRPTQLPARPNAFSGVNDGARANQFSNRGAQSRGAQATRPAGGGAGRSAPARSGGGGRLNR